MSMVQLINGDYVPEGQAALTTNNRAYRYGDGFFESMRVSNGAPLFAEAHWKRVVRTAGFLRIDIPQELNLRPFHSYMKQLCAKNGLAQARIRFQGFRQGAGNYAPETDRLGWTMTSHALSSDRYLLNEKGLHVGICGTHRINPTPQSAFKTTNALPYVLGGLYAADMQWDDCLLLDTQGSVAESTNANLFLIKGDMLLTPDLSNGGVHGVMRSVVLRLATKAGLTPQTVPISEEDLLQADECLLTNAVRGIRWVGALGRKRYFRKKAELLTTHLNALFSTSLPDPRIH